jgi:hypothetical protein
MAINCSFMAMMNDESGRLIAGWAECTEANKKRQTYGQKSIFGAPP